MNNQMELFGEGGLKDEGGMVDEVSGNEVPVGGTKEGVRDDISANVSEGEFIFPADVVRFVGLDKLMQIRQDAKMGLKKMEAMGQMGNSDEATMDDDMPFGMADLIVVGGKGEPMELADGGFVPVQNFQEGGMPSGQRELVTAPVPIMDSNEEIDYEAYMNSVITEVKEYRNEDGEKINITFINGVPFPPIPEGFTLYVPDENEPPSEESQIADVINKSNDSDTYRQVSNMTSSEIKDATRTGPNYVAMSDEEFIERMKYENTTSYKLQKAIGLGVASIVPLGGVLAYGTMRGHARASEERLRDIISKQTDQTKIDEYTTVLNNTLKGSGLTASEDSNKYIKGLDKYLIGKGYTTEQVSAATNAVANPADNVTNIMNNATSESIDPRGYGQRNEPVFIDTQIKNRMDQIEEKVNSGGVMTPEESELIANETLAMIKSLGTPSDESVSAVDDLLAGKPNDLLATTRAAKQTSAPTTSLRPQIRTPNTQLQDMANRLTPGDGKEYKFGKLRDAKGNRVNTMYQKLANALTLNDGKSYVGGVLIDESTEQPIQQKQKDEPNRANQGTFKAINSSAGVLSKLDLSSSSDNFYGAYKGGIYAGDGFEWNKEGGRTYTGVNKNATGSTDIAQGRFEDIEGNYIDSSNIDKYRNKVDTTSIQQNIPKIVTSDKNRQDDKDREKQQQQENERQTNKFANEAAVKAEKEQTDAGRIESREQKIKRGGGFNKGGLASKPIKTKKTKKRGLAAR